MKLKYMNMTYATNETKASITTSLFLTCKQRGIFPLQKKHLFDYTTVLQTFAQPPKPIKIIIYFMHSK